MNQNDAPTSGRVKELDALRGLAAFGVVLHHALNLDFPSREAMFALFCSPFAPLISGRPMVLLFFVLSGFVLHAAITGEAARTGTAPTVASFAARRIARIYLPFAAAAVLSLGILVVAAHLTTIHASDTTPSIRGWLEPISRTSGLTLLAQHLTLSGLIADLSLNGPAWSLVYELRITVFMPILWLVVRKWGWASLAATAALAFLVGSYIEGHASTNAGLDEQMFRGFPDLAASWLATLYFAPMFILGALAYEALRRSSFKLDELDGRRLALVAGGAIVLFAVPNDVAICVASVLFIALACHAPRCKALLNTAPLQHLGRLSFSLYLVHYPVMFGVMAVLGGLIPVHVANLLGVALALLASQGFWYVVERPCLQLSRRLAHPAVSLDRPAAA